MASSSAPTISSFSPISGLPGTRVTISGPNFSVADPVDLSVLFNVTEAVLESVSTTSIVAIVPLGATTGLLQVRTPSGTASSMSNFTVTTPAPVISSFSPVSGRPGDLVRIAGMGFSEIDTVKFNGVQTLFTRESDTSITATVPSEATTGPIKFFSHTRTVSSPGNFTVERAAADTVPPTVTVDYPNGGESFQPGRVATIRWRSSDDVGVVAHDVRFSATGGEPFELIASNLPGNQQSFDWTVPNRQTSQSLIRVVARDTAGNVGMARSAGTFRIAAEVVQRGYFDLLDMRVLDPDPDDPPLGPLVTGAASIKAGQTFSFQTRPQRFDKEGRPVTDDVQLSLDGVPAAATLSIVPNPARTFTPFTVTIATSSQTPPNTYTLRLQGKSTRDGMAYEPLDMLLQVRQPTPRVKLHALPLERGVEPGAPAQYDITLSRTRDLVGVPVTLFLEGSLPAGATATFTPLAPREKTATLTITTLPTTPPGRYGPLVVNGTASVVVEKATIVDAPPVFLRALGVVSDMTLELVAVPQGGVADAKVKFTDVFKDLLLTFTLETNPGTKGQAVFAANNSNTIQLRVNQNMSIPIRGLTASSTKDNIVLRALTGDIVVATTTFSVVWVTIDIRTSRKERLSTNNSARASLMKCYGTDRLGLRMTTGTCDKLFANIVELVGKVMPPDFDKPIVLARTVRRAFYNGDDPTPQEPKNGPDTSRNRDRDDIAADSNGFIYDSDHPGIASDPMATVGTVLRIRHQFKQFALFGGTVNEARGEVLGDFLRVSDDFLWHSNVSIMKTSQGDVLDRKYDARGDNTVFKDKEGPITVDLK